MKLKLIRLKPVIIFLGVMMMLGGGVFISGVIPIGASSGHWPITAWFLNFAMERSVKTYSLGIETPESIGQSWMVQKGAGHYEIGCRQCHGAPGSLTNVLGQKMTPRAPVLSPQIAHWQKKELFRIVKHGVKFTAMPAWPSLERDDEIWAMVSFLSKLPELSAYDYKKLVYEKKSTEPIIWQSCLNCHGMDGNGRETAAYPKLAGQNVDYLKASLHAYQNGRRKSGIMWLAVASLTEEMIDEFSHYFNGQKRIFVQKRPDDERTQLAIERGRLIAHQGIPTQRVARCISCHGPHPEMKDFNKRFPQLSGQFAEYLELQLSLFVKGDRLDSSYTSLMHQSLNKMTKEQIKDVALYYESL